MEEEEMKRLFFGVEVQAPWPAEWPSGRLLDEAHRHMTLAFLGNIPYSPLSDLLVNIPEPPLRVGLTGYFDDCLTLPPRHPHVVAWHARWYDDHQPLARFQKSLVDWLKGHHYAVDAREWLPHVTICRQPFNPQAWKRAFVPLPFYVGSIHLYESLGQLVYKPVWSHLIRAPFEEISHTADVAFMVYGETLLQLYHHAFTAIAFKFPPFLDFFIPNPPLKTLDDLVIGLNDIVGKADSEIGCPLKAVSFHGEINQMDGSILQWEMIVDV